LKDLSSNRFSISSLSQFGRTDKPLRNVFKTPENKPILSRMNALPLMKKKE